MIYHGEGSTMIRYPSIAAVICGVLTTSCTEPGAAQTYERTQPIVLTASPSRYESPARISQQPLVVQTFGGSYMSPSVSESIPSVIAASEMVPLPAGPAWRRYSAKVVAPVMGYTVPAPVALPAQSVQVLRPVTGPSVPDGYVVGRGLIGQPKLYKPGQPVRNLLRYLSL
jgi:hypothetical protein